MSVAQSDFAAGLLDPARPAPEGLVNPDGAPATKRFDVYRNNVAASLTDALEIAFPVIRKLVGEANFRILAGAYLRQFPPKTPMLMFYGEEMPAFLQSFGPVQALGYLPDVATLELSLRESYHAADSSPIDPAILQGTPADRLMAARLVLAPAVRLIRSPWPVHAIWRFNMEAEAPKPGPVAQDVLITRPDYDPEMTVLGPGGGSFVAALLQRKSFSAALDAATAVAEEFDLAATLGTLIAGAALIELHED